MIILVSIITFFVGTLMGFFICAILSAGGRSDEQMEQIFKEK
jgi:hypothetical protein